MRSTQQISFSHPEEVFADVQQVLGVPFTNLIFHRLAAWPDVLATAWERTRPLVLTTAFAEQAAALRMIALQQPAADDFAWPAGLASAEIRRIRLLTDAYVRVQPQLLLLVAGWARAVGRTQSSDCRDREPPKLPRLQARPAPGRGDPSSDVAMITLPPEDSRVAQLFSEMIDKRRHPGIASYYRNLAQWPSLLAESWRVIRPSLDTPDYGERARRLAFAADAAVSNLGLDAIGPVGPTEHTETLLMLLLPWRDVQVPQLMLDTARLKQAFTSARP